MGIESTSKKGSWANSKIVIGIATVAALVTIGVFAIGVTSLPQLFASINHAKIVGTWADSSGQTMAFSDGGRLEASFLSGTYELHGKTLEVTVIGFNHVYTVEKLTGSQLVLSDENGTYTFQKVK